MTFTLKDVIISVRDYIKGVKKENFSNFFYCSSFS